MHSADKFIWRDLQAFLHIRWY